MIPDNWVSLCHREQDMFSFPSGVLYDLFRLKDKELVISKEDDIFLFFCWGQGGVVFDFL